MFIKIKDLILTKMIRFLQSRDYYVAKPHFYNPIPDENYIYSYEGYWKKPYPCYGIEFCDKEQLLLCKNLSFFAQEINDLPEFILDPKKNDGFLDMDLEFLYCLIRFIKPKRFIEIGAGWSSLIAIQAIQRNKEEGYECEHTLIEPYPRSALKGLFEKVDKYIFKCVQEVPLNVFDDLGHNDILFIDTSHVAKYGSDVNYLYFYIVPRVKSGCYIHIHDIFIPDDYSEKLIFTQQRFFSEQYLIFAFLMYNHDFQIRIAAQYLSQKYRDKLNDFFPRFKPYFSPGSLWIQRK